MNRAVSTNLDGIGPGDVPPPGHGGRTRALFLTLDGMGWSTYAGELATSTAARDDLDAVHVRYRTGLGKRLFSVPVPGGRGRLDSHVRRVRLARWITRRWLSGPLDLSRFDVIHVTPQQYALGAVDVAGPSATALSVVLDATVYQAKGELGGLDRAGVERQYGPLVDAETTVFDAADQVVAFSGWAAASATTSFGVPESKVTVIPPGLHRRSATPAPGERARRGLPRLVFVGRDWTRKGGDRLLRWHQQRWADRAELHLVSAGAEVAPGARNVVCHGAVPHDVLLTGLLPSMDIFVLPTTKDMSPWAVLEAAASGLAVVSSAIAGLAELVIHGETGFLLDPGDERGFVDAVERLLDDPALRARMGAAALAHFEAHLNAATTNEHLLDRLVELRSIR